MRSMPAFHIALGLWAACAPLAAEPLPVLKKERVRTTLEGVDLHARPAAEFPNLAPAPIDIEWKLLPDMPLVVKAGVAGVLNNHLVIVPGIGFREHDGVVQGLNLKTKEWVRLPDIPKPPVYTTGVTARDSIIVLSGRGDSKPPVDAAVQRLRFAGGKWVWDELPPLPNKIWYASSACVDDRWIVVSNGDVGRGQAADQASRDVWVLDLDDLDEGWRTVGRYEHGVLQPMLGGVDGKVYFFGGAIFDPEQRKRYEEAVAEGKSWPNNGWLRQKYAYGLDLKNRQWRRCADLPIPLSGGVARAYGRYILVFGGSPLTSRRPGRSTTMPDLWRGYNDRVLLYDTSRDSWSILDHLAPYATNNPQVAISGNTVYMAGGEPDHGYNNNTEDVCMMGVIRPANN